MRTSIKGRSSWSSWSLRLRQHRERLPVVAGKIAVRLPVVAEGLGLRVEVEDAAGPVARVGEVTERGGEVAFLDVGGQVGCAAAADRGPEIRHVRSPGPTAGARG